MESVKIIVAKISNESSGVEVQYLPSSIDDLPKQQSLKYPILNVL